MHDSFADKLQRDWLVPFGDSLIRVEILLTVVVQG